MLASRVAATTNADILFEGIIVSSLFILGLIIYTEPRCLHVFGSAGASIAPLTEPDTLQESKSPVQAQSERLNG
jgi:hypothetical protein